MPTSLSAAANDRDSGSSASAVPQITKQGGGVPGLIARKGLTRVIECGRILSTEITARHPLDRGTIRRSLDGGGEVKYTIDERSGAKFGCARIAGEGDEGSCGQICPGGIAGNCHAGRISVPAPGVFGGPFRREYTIVEARGEGVLGCEAVINVDREIALLGKLHPELAMRRQAASHPSAAVNEHRHGVRSIAFGHCDVGE